MVLARENALYAFRDPHGIRPLVLGKLGEGEWVVASETCALDIVGATYVREVAPGEIIRISDDGFRSEQGVPPQPRADCIFEHVYFSRPDSVKDGSSFYLMRHNMGRRLARETPVDADLVISVPDSGTPAAEATPPNWGCRTAPASSRTATLRAPSSSPRRPCARWACGSSSTRCPTWCAASAS